jgi:hypothetical protein
MKALHLAATPVSFRESRRFNYSRSASAVFCILRFGMTANHTILMAETSGNGGR